MTGNESQFLHVIVICLVYCLVQLPINTPQTLISLATDVFHNNTVYEQGIGGTALEITETTLFYGACAVASVLAVCITLPPVYTLLISSILSLTSVCVEANASTGVRYTIAVCCGASYGGIYVSTTTLIYSRTEQGKLSRNFSFFAACCGATYILYASLLFINLPDSGIPHSVTQYLALATRLLGCLVAACYAAIHKLRTTKNMAKSDSVVLGSLLFTKRIDALSKVEGIVAAVFYIFCRVLSQQLYSSCWGMRNAYHAEVAVPYGAGFMLAAMQWSYCYTNWSCPVRSVSGVVVLWGSLFAAATLDASCSQSYVQLLQRWYAVPVIGFLLGLAMGSVTCEVYTFVSAAWQTSYRFTVLVLLESILALAFLFGFSYVGPDWCLVVCAVLGLAYCLCVVDFQRKSRRFSSRVNEYILKVNSAYNRRKYLFVY